jgi:hypothetical protein
LTSYSIAASRRSHERVDLSRQQLEAWLLLGPASHREDGYTACRFLTLSYAGMCLWGEDLVEIGRAYRFILDLSALLGTEVEVTARIVWKRPMDAGLCYTGAVFVKSSAPWLGPDEEEDFSGPALAGQDGESG